MSFRTRLDWDFHNKCALQAPKVVTECITAEFQCRLLVDDVVQRSALRARPCAVCDRELLGGMAA